MPDSAGSLHLLSYLISLVGCHLCLQTRKSRTVKLSNCRRSLAVGGEVGYSPSSVWLQGLSSSLLHSLSLRNAWLSALLLPLLARLKLASQHRCSDSSSPFWGQAAWDTWQDHPEHLEGRMEHMIVLYSCKYENGRPSTDCPAHFTPNGNNKGSIFFPWLKFKGSFWGSSKNTFNNMFLAQQKKSLKIF